MKKNVIGYRELLKNIEKVRNYNEKEAKKIVDQFLAALKKTVANREVKRICFLNFGTFYFHDTKPRVRKIPNGELITSETREILKFRLNPRMLLDINHLRENKKEEVL